MERVRFSVSNQRFLYKLHALGMFLLGILDNGRPNNNDMVTLHKIALAMPAIHQTV